MLKATELGVLGSFQIPTRHDKLRPIRLPLLSGMMWVWDREADWICWGLWVQICQVRSWVQPHSAYHWTRASEEADLRERAGSHSSTPRRETGRVLRVPTALQITWSTRPRLILKIYFSSTSWGRSSWFLLLTTKRILTPLAKDFPRYFQEKQLKSAFI